MNNVEYTEEEKIHFMKEALAQVSKTSDSDWLTLGLSVLFLIDQAELAEQNNEVPVGCVFVYNKHIITYGYNGTNKSRNVKMSIKK